MSNETSYKTNSKGHLVPKDSIRDIDLLRDELVTSIIDRTLKMKAIMQIFKSEVLSDIEIFMQLAGEQYDVKLGGRKGNLSLSSYDGQYKVMIAVSDSLEFDERLHVAKQLIDGCIHRWTENSDANVKALVEHAFQTDKQGNINTARVLGLLQLKIIDQDWEQAMKAIKESIKVTSSKSYLRFYQRVGGENKYDQIALDMGAL